MLAPGVHRHSSLSLGKPKVLASERSHLHSTGGPGQDQAFQNKNAHASCSIFKDGFPKEMVQPFSFALEIWHRDHSVTWCVSV